MTFTPKWKFDAVLAAIVAAWFIGGRALLRSVDLDVFLVQATAILTFLFLSAAISVGPLSRLWPPATHFVYNRRHLGVATWALAVSHAAVVMHFGNSWKPANVLEVLPGQKVAGVPFTLLGVGALAILTVMALTSWDHFLHAWTPPAWKRLHMAVYAAYALIVFHFTARFVGDPPVKWGFLVLLWLVALAVAVLHVAASLKEARRDRPAPADGDGLVFLGTFVDLPEDHAATVHVDGERVAVVRKDGASVPSPRLSASERPPRRGHGARRLSRVSLARLSVRPVHGPAPGLHGLGADLRPRAQGQGDVPPVAPLPSSDREVMTMRRPFLANPRGLGYTKSSAMKQRHRAAIVLLVALLSFAFALEGSQPGHTHENGRLGLYNAECPLSQLAAVHADGWAPESPAVATPKQIDMPTAVTSSGGFSSPSASLTDSRAPPLA